MQRRVENLIYGNIFLCALIFIPFVEPLFFTKIVLLDTLFYYWKLLAMAVIFITWFLNFRIDNALFCLFLFLGLDCFVTYINQGNISQMLINSFTLLAMVIMFKTAALKASYPFIKVASTILGILILANLFVIILFPQGIYNFTAVNAHYLLGSRNVMMRTIFPGVCFTIINSKIYKNKLTIWSIMILVATGISLILVWSATALFAYVLFFLLLLISYTIGLPKWFNVKFCYFVALVLFIFIVLFRLQSAFSFIIEGILHKDMTFTGRINLWDNTINYILQAPFFGYGLEYLQTISDKIYPNQYISYDSCHNLFLDIIYQNGIVGLFLIAVLFIKTEKKIDVFLPTKYKTIFTLFIFTYALMINFEPFINGDMRLLVAILFFMHSFNYEKVENKRKWTSKIKIII